VRKPTLTSFAAGAIFALVAGSGTAVAATGGKLILGQANSATSTTTVTNSRGPALSLKSKAGTPPLVVNSRTRVGNLNADTVDGVDSSALARTAGRTGVIDASGELVDNDTTDAYPFDTIVAYAECPAGTQLTGGGFEDYTGTGYEVVNRADTGAEAWMVVAAFDPTVTESADDVVASAVCASPTRAVADRPAATTTRAAAAAALTPQVRRALVAKAAAAR
jgi:hypothetical protein